MLGAEGRVGVDPSILLSSTCATRKAGLLDPARLPFQRIHSPAIIAKGAGRKPLSALHREELTGDGVYRLFRSMALARAHSTWASRPTRRRRLAGVANLLAALALFAQLLALPYHHPQAHTELAAVSASLKATFGPSAILCTQATNDAPTTPDHRRQPCGFGDCPLCQFAAQTVLFDAPPPAPPPTPRPARRAIAAAGRFRACAFAGARFPRPARPRSKPDQRNRRAPACGRADHFR